MSRRILAKYSKQCIKHSNDDVETDVEFSTDTLRVVLMGDVGCRLYFCRKWPCCDMIVLYIDGLIQYCSISSALALQILQSCTKPSVYHSRVKNHISELIHSDTLYSVTYLRMNANAMACFLLAFYQAFFLFLMLKRKTKGCFCHLNVWSVFSSIKKSIAGAIVWRPQLSRHT